MVLAVDIGNSNICIGGLTGAEHCSIQFTMRMVTRPRCTADEYAAEMKFLLRRLQVDPAACEGVIVCSVVPQLTEVLAAACKRLTGRGLAFRLTSLPRSAVTALPMPPLPPHTIPCPA